MRSRRGRSSTTAGTMAGAMRTVRRLPCARRSSRDATRTIIARNNSPDISFDRSINPYRGCEHGCIYCFARPTHAYLGMSPGADFESRLFAKPNAAELLAKELVGAGLCAARPSPSAPTPIPISRSRRRCASCARSSRCCAISSIRSASSPNRRWCCATSTSSATWRAMGLAKVALSVTTLDRKLARAMEPRAGTPPRRLETIKALSDAGIPAGVMFAPVIPALNDGEMETMLAAADRMPARARRAMCCCACRSRSRICSANGSRRTSRTAPGTSCR